jgi:hypothetical protein
MTKTIYRDEDLAKQDFKIIIADALILWQNKCAEYYKINGDVGSCVLGAGFAVLYLGPRKKKPVKRIIIDAFDATRAQGSCTWESSKPTVEAFLKDRGIDCTYEWGNLD